MKIFKMIYSYAYYFYVKLAYTLLYQNDKEHIYKSNRNKYKRVIFVQDAEVGKKLYDIIKALDSTSLLKSSRFFKLEKYGLGRNKQIKWFSIEVLFDKNRINSSKLQELINTQRFVTAMHKEGFVLDRTNFKCSGYYNSISEFLSFFIQSNDKEAVKRSKGCMIELIHYVLTDGGILEKDYEVFEEKGVFEQYDNVRYSLPIIKLCYDYFKNGNVSESIYAALHASDRVNFKNRTMVVIPETVTKNFSVTEKTMRYTIYDGSIKIYSNMTPKYQELVSRFANGSLELIKVVIVDLNGNVIGYKFEKECNHNTYAILDYPFESQNQIFECVSSLMKFIGNYNKGQVSICQDNFEIENALVCTLNSEQEFEFRSNSIDDWFNFSNYDLEKLKNQITALFFKLLLRYLKQKYLELASAELYLKKDEVRFLSPIVAREFVKFAMQEEVNYFEATRELLKLFNNRAVSKDGKFSYDKRFAYDPTEVTITFDSEVNEKYDCNFVRGIDVELKDGRKIVSFWKPEDISRFYKEENLAKAKVLEVIPNIEDDHIKFVEISEVIIETKKLNGDNMYDMVGFVVDGISGTQLIEENLVNMNNRDFLKVAAYWFNKFYRTYIDGEHVWMDKDFVFYIDYIGGCTFSSFPNIPRNSTFLHRIIEYYECETRMNPNYFVGLNLHRNPILNKYYLLELANSFDAYCEEHKIYYDSRNGLCPVCLKKKYFVPKNYKEVFKKVFEDAVAIHYAIDSEYNLKVYKEKYKAKIVKNVKQILDGSWSDGNSWQDCFIPCKIAVDENNEAIGYIYDTTKFEASLQGNNSDVCFDLGDVKSLVNLARLKSLIRLIYQVKNMTNCCLGFVQNPFTHVFLNRSHKKQVQILNIDFIAFVDLNGITKTRRWIFEYVCNILKLDQTFELSEDFFSHTRNLELLLSELEELASQMTGYCSLHNMYYKSTYLYCPKCIEPANQSMDVNYVSKWNYQYSRAIDEGGESFIYSEANGKVAKVFKENEVDMSFKKIVLFRIMSKKQILEKLNKEDNKYKYVIPYKILAEKEKGIFGYTMDRIKDAYPISTLRDKAQIKKLNLSRKDIFEILITIGEGIEALHRAANIFIGDLNGRNILFDTDKNVYFLDFDGMGVDEISPYFFTDGYIDPISKNNRNITMKDDWYSFAVHVFYYLTYTHPFNGIYYVEQKGKRVLLEIPDKMERRISLLGSHGMKAPEVAYSWHWMTSELKRTFLNIFEGDYRESIVPQLKKQYEILFFQSFGSSVAQKDNVFHINPKFVASRLSLFDNREVVKMLTPYTAVCERGDVTYIGFLNKSNVQRVQENISIPSIDADDCVVSNDGKVAFIFYRSKECILIEDVETKSLFYQQEVSDATNIIVNDRSIYFDGFYNGKPVVNKKTIQTDGRITSEIFNIGIQELKYFSVTANSKFILIGKSADNVHELYCNSEKIYSITYTSTEVAEHVKYNIIYDEARKSWLIVNSNGFAVIIQMNGEVVELHDLIAEYINDANIKNISFEKGNIYIPGTDCLFIYNVSSKLAKKMECKGIMTPESKLYEIDAYGFSVITHNTLYQVRKV